MGTWVRIELHVTRYANRVAFASVAPELSLREGFFLVPVSPPVRFEGAENCVFF